MTGHMGDRDGLATRPSCRGGSRACCLARRGMTRECELTCGGDAQLAAGERACSRQRRAQPVIVWMVRFEDRHQAFRATHRPYDQFTPISFGQREVGGVGLHRFILAHIRKGYGVGGRGVWSCSGSNIQGLMLSGEPLSRAS